MERLRDLRARSVSALAVLVEFEELPVTAALNEMFSLILGEIVLTGSSSS